MKNKSTSNTWIYLSVGFVVLCSGCAAISTASPTQTLAPTPTSPTQTLAPTSTWTPNVVPTPTEQAAEPLVYDPDTQSGVEVVDRVVDIVMSGNLEDLRGIIKFTLTGCTNADGLGGPPKCRDGEAEGTLVEVLPFMGSEGHFIHREDIEGWPGVEVVGLYAVYRVSEEAFSDDNYPASEYGIVFIHKDKHGTVTLQVQEGSIVRIDYHFGYPPEIDLDRDAEEVILPPLG
jgi:hypothetical protein